MRQIFAIVFLVVLLAPYLAGCTVKTALESFMLKIASGDYQGAYSLISDASQQLITEEEFCKRYNDIYSSVKIESINILPQPSGANESLKVKFVTGLIGELELEFAAETVTEGGKTKIAWTPGLIYPGMDWGDTFVVSRIKPIRGEIFDSNGNLIAQNSFAEAIYAIPSKIKELDEVLDRVTKHSSVSRDKLKKAIQDAVNKDQPVVLDSFMPGTLSQRARSELAALDGVGVDSAGLVPLRLYTVPESVAHMVGYVGSIPEKKLQEYIDNGYDKSDYAGLGGIELAYEETLRGQSGFEVFIRSKDGTKKSSIYKKPAIKGMDLHLTIDLNLQTAAEESLKNRLDENQPGVIIIMDSENGDLLAVANHPSYDPNLFNFPVPAEIWEKLNSKDSGSPLFNHATNGLYPPGSLLKLFTAAACLETGTIRPGFVFDEPIDDNKWKPENEPWPYPAIKRFKDSGKPLNLERAIMQSDNIYFAYITLKLGEQLFTEYMQKYGFGEAIEFDLPAAVSRILNKDTVFNRKLLADSGFGQGEMLLSPLQMAAMYCAFNMDGDIPVPRIVSAVYKEEGYKYLLEKEIERKIWKQSVLSEDTIDTLLPMMKKTMTDGTGRGALPSGIEAAGKTGTAQLGGSKEISWLCSFETEGDKKLLVLVMAETPTEEGNVKYSLTRDVYYAWRDIK